MASRTCISLIGPGNAPAYINQLYNAAGGASAATVEQMAGIVIATAVVENFSVSASFEFCGGPVCFDGVTNLGDVCGVIVHECPTGKPEPCGRILDWKPAPVNGLSCPDGRVCFTFNCWPVRPPCVDEPEPVDIDFCCGDPCLLACMFQAAYAKTALGDYRLAFRNADKSISYGKPDRAAIKELRDEYLQECADRQNCGAIQSRVMQWRLGNC